MVFAIVAVLLNSGRWVCLGVSNQRFVLWQILQIGSGLFIRTISGRQLCLFVISCSCIASKLISMAILETLNCLILCSKFHSASVNFKD